MSIIITLVALFVGFFMGRELKDDHTRDVEESLKDLKEKCEHYREEIYMHQKKNKYLREDLERLMSRKSMFDK